MLLKCAVFSPFLKTPSFYRTKINPSKKFTLWKDYHSSLTKGHTVDLVCKGRNPFIATSNALIALTKHLPSNTFFLQSLFLETHLTVKKNPFGWRGSQRLPSGGHTVTWTIKAVKNWVGVGQGAVPGWSRGRAGGLPFGALVWACIKKATYLSEYMADSLLVIIPTTKQPAQVRKTMVTSWGESPGKKWNGFHYSDRINRSGWEKLVTQKTGNGSFSTLKDI